MGNIGSIQNMLDYLNFKSKIIDQPQEVERSKKLFCQE